ncbi:hypothetical protein PHMEG_00026508 [Phytophthora megakarya]|uniref:CCHC-type domain-containing protein n=1 Tax=Phytophthora megakarya TaxID=4795 RepID=A0A225V9K0_9STRA|nr:hypothetical protein PHMEG_00026508 [Phytophthora megakarya]
MDEDSARAWIDKVKSAFQRDQATDEEKCLTFEDRMVGSAKNWHRQLSRTTKTRWADLLESFQTQYCGLGMSVAWQYYHVRKSSEETPLDYLYRLNVAALRAKLMIKDGNPNARREHVDHYIETLGDPELADRLTLLRLADVDELEEVLHARERAKSRQRRSAFGSNFRQKVPASAPTAPARSAVRAIQTHDPRSESDGVSGSDGSDAEGDLRRTFLAAAEEKLISTGGAPQNPDLARSRTNASKGSRISDRRSPGDRDHQDRERCSHCGSRKHTDLDCWKRLICEKCGKRGHPTDRCLYACRGCGDVHEAGECPMEEFYNQIRKWYDPTRHAGLFPEQVEKIYCIYAYVNKATADRDRKKSGLCGNTCNLHPYTTKIASLPQISEFSRSNVEVALDLKRGESRGYWKRHSPGKWFRQAKISGKINHERAILLLDTGAEVSILDTTFARRIGDLSGQNAILGMDFMVPAGVRMDLADGSMRLPDEVGIPLNGRKRLSDRSLSNNLYESRSEETAAKIELSATEKLWVTRGERWVSTVTEGPGRIRYLVISNIGDRILRLDHRLDVGMILDQDKVPRSPGFVSVGSRRYREWQNPALESTVNTRSEPKESMEYPSEPVVQRPSYPTPRSILRRPGSDEIDRDQTWVSTLESRPRAGIADATQIEAESSDPGRGRPSTPTTSPMPIDACAAMLRADG